MRASTNLEISVGIRFDRIVCTEYVSVFFPCLLLAYQVLASTNPVMSASNFPLNLSFLNLKFNLNDNPTRMLILCYYSTSVLSCSQTVFEFEQFSVAGTATAYLTNWETSSKN